MNVLESKTGTRSERDSELQTNVGLKQGTGKNAKPAIEYSLSKRARVYERVRREKE